MNNLRHEAELLRQQGFSYALINQKLGISKSTMSYWFKDKPFTPNKQVLERIKNGPENIGLKRHNERVQKVQQLKIQGIQELGKLSKRDLWLLGLGIYIGEGAKTIESVRIANSDPAVIVIAIRWLKEICNVTNDNIVISIHAYPDTDLSKAIEFWQTTTGLSRANFRKTRIDTRKNKTVKRRGKLPHGTAHLRVKGNGDPSRGVALHRRINGWITGALNQV